MPEPIGPEQFDLLQALCERAFGPAASTPQGYVFRLQIEDRTGMAELSQPHVKSDPGWLLTTTRDQLLVLEGGGFFERAPHGVRQHGHSVARAGLTPRARAWHSERTHSEPA